MEFSLLDRWPKDGCGEPEEAVLLCNSSDFPDDLPILCSMLESFNIPYLAKHHGAAHYMNLLFGHSATGIEVYVPASCLEEARSLLEAPPAFDEDSPQTK